MINLEVRKFFEFDEGDLQANRAGKLSSKQQTKINESEKDASQMFFWAGVVFLLIALGASFGILWSTFNAGFTLTSKTDWIEPAIWLVLTWGVFGFLAAGSFRISRSRFDSSVVNVEGKVKFVKVEKEEEIQSIDGRRSTQSTEEYELRVGGIAFENVEEDLLDIIEQGDTYAFYYTKDTKDILSCEFISKGK